MNDLGLNISYVLLLLLIIVIIFVIGIITDQYKTVKVGEHYRRFDDNEMRVVNPYKKNYKDYKVIEVSKHHCLCRNIETHEKESFEIGQFLAFSLELEEVPVA